MSSLRSPGHGWAVVARRSRVRATTHIDTSCREHEELGLTQAGSRRGRRPGLVDLRERSM